MLRRLAVLCAAVAPGCGDSSAPVDPASEFPQSAYLTLPSESGKLHVEVRTAPDQPPPRGDVAVEYSITDTSGAPEEGLLLVVVPWMPDHGHGASTVPEVTARE